MKDAVKAKGLRVAKSVLPGATWEFQEESRQLDEYWGCFLEDTEVFCFLVDGTWEIHLHGVDPMEAKEAKKYFHNQVKALQAALRRPKKIKE